MAELVINITENLKTKIVKTDSGKALWEFPWLYKESFLITSGLLFIGVVLEVMSAGSGVRALFWPYNIIFGLAFISVSSLIHVYSNTWGKQNISLRGMIKWLASVPASLSAIGLLFFMVVLLGLIPQQETAETAKWIKLLGLTHITSSWPFIMSLLYLLTTLLFTIFKRIYPFSFKNLAFFINHAGLWIALFAGFLGAGDLKRLTMDLYEGEVVWQAKDENNKLINMPLAFNLSKFDIEEYNPKLVMVNTQSWDVLSNPGEVAFVLNQGHQAVINNWQVSVERYYSGALRNGGIYLASDEIGSAPAAYIKAVSLADGSLKEGWVSCGSFIDNPQLFNLTDDLAFAMTVPEPKKFSSQVKGYTHDGKIEDIILEVNKPHVIAGWKVYQVSYDDRFGKWSQLSVIELIRDPWLPVVYIGIFMMIAGACYMFWIGKEIKQ
jgi:hypothetical protein